MSKRERGALTFQLLDWVYRCLLLLTLLMGCWQFGVLPLPAEGETLPVLAIGYLVVLTTVQKVYHACNYGHARVTELVLSQVLTILLCTSAAYVCVALYVHSLFSPWSLLVVAMVQIGVSALWSVAMNWLWYKNYHPPRTVIVYGDEESLQYLLNTPDFEKRYDVRKLVKEPENDSALCDAVEGFEALFTIGVSAAMTNRIAKVCVGKDIQGYFVPRLGHIIIAGAEHQSNFNVPVLCVQRGGRHADDYRPIKRLIDIGIALIGLVLASPIMLLTALAIKCEDGGPVFYRQTRLTKNRRPFSIMKFRSMKVNAESDGVARLAGGNDSRVTRVGRLIRASRIDELPQLINILIGDMSVVGPRPERPEIAQQYEAKLPEFALRLQVKAGLTGIAQVYGRYNTEPYNKLQMDLMYVNQMSFLTDMKLIIATLKTVFVRESTQGVAEGQTTAMKRKHEHVHHSA